MEIDKKLIEHLKKSLNIIASKLPKKITEAHSMNKFKMAQKLSEILSQIYAVIGEMEKEKNTIVDFLTLIKKTKATPEDLLNLLSLSDIPVIISGGRTVVEGIVGYRGLGIETIDHHVDKIAYENIRESESEGPLTDISITSFVYRVPPFELTRCPYERGKDAEITKILGARHVWLVRPENVSEYSWKGIQDKAAGGRRKDIIVGSYDRVGSVLQLKTLKLVDITQRCLEIEVEKPAFFLKLGSTRLEDELVGITNRDRLIEELRVRESDKEIIEFDEVLDKAKEGEITKEEALLFKDVNPEENLKIFYEEFLPLPYKGVWIVSIGGE